MDHPARGRRGTGDITGGAGAKRIFTIKPNTHILNPVHIAAAHRWPWTANKISYHVTLARRQYPGGQPESGGDCTHLSCGMKGAEAACLDGWGGGFRRPGQGERLRQREFSDARG